MEKIRVIIDNQQKEVKIPTGLRMLVRRCCNAVLRLEKFNAPAEISVTFVDNEQIQELNKKYRNKDVPTDVLSFPMGEMVSTIPIIPQGQRFWVILCFPWKKQWSKPIATLTAWSGKWGI